MKGGREAEGGCFTVYLGRKAILSRGGGEEAVLPREEGGMSISSKGGSKFYQAEPGSTPGEGRLISVRTPLETFPPFVFEVETPQNRFPCGSMKNIHKKGVIKVLFARKTPPAGRRKILVFFLPFRGGNRRGGGKPKAAEGGRRKKPMFRVFRSHFTCFRMQ